MSNVLFASQSDTASYPLSAHASTFRDQAAGLRRIMANPRPRIVSVISTSSPSQQQQLLSNIAASMQLQGSDVLILRADKHTASTMPTLLDVATQQASWGRVVRWTDCLIGQSTTQTMLSSAAEPGQTRSRQGFAYAQLLPSTWLEQPLDTDMESLLTEHFSKVAQEFEVVLVAASLNKNRHLPLKLLHRHEILVQLSLDPESIKQAYVFIKQICSQIGRRSFGILVDAATEKEAELVFQNISQVCRRYMQIDLEFVGAIPPDEHLGKARQLGRNVIDAFPMASASAALQAIAQHFDSTHYSRTSGQTSLV